MEIMTRDLQKKDIDGKEIISFMQGIPAFEDEKEFVLLQLDEDSPFFILQSVKTPELAFVTLEPWNYVPGYDFHIGEEVVNFLEVEKPRDLIVLVIGTMNKHIEDITVNLTAPLLINYKKRLGKQIILEDKRYPLRHPLFSSEKKGVG